MDCNQDEWALKYKDNLIYWHQDNAYPLFWSSVQKVLGSNTDKTFFFPMCGKTVEMKQLHDKGYTVIGM